MVFSVLLNRLPSRVYFLIISVIFSFLCDFSVALPPVRHIGKFWKRKILLTTTGSNETTYSCSTTGSDSTISSTSSAMTIINNQTTPNNSSDANIVKNEINAFQNVLLNAGNEIDQQSLQNANFSDVFIPTTLSVPGLFSSGDLVSIVSGYSNPFSSNVYYNINMLTRCDSCINPPSLINVPMDNVVLPTTMNDIAVAISYSGSQSAYSTWRISVLQAPVSATGQPTQNAQIQIISDNGHFLRRTQINVTFDEYLVAVDGIASTNDTIWEVITSSSDPSGFYLTALGNNSQRLVIDSTRSARFTVEMLPVVKHADAAFWKDIGMKFFAKTLPVTVHLKSGTLLRKQNVYAPFYDGEWVFISPAESRLVFTQIPGLGAYSGTFGIKHEPYIVERPLYLAYNMFSPLNLFKLEFVSSPIYDNDNGQVRFKTFDGSCLSLHLPHTSDAASAGPGIEFYQLRSDNYQCTFSLRWVSFRSAWTLSPINAGMHDSSPAVLNALANSNANSLSATRGETISMLDSNFRFVHIDQQLVQSMLSFPVTLPWAPRTDVKNTFMNDLSGGFLLFNNASSSLVNVAGDQFNTICTDPLSSGAMWIQPCSDDAWNSAFASNGILSPSIPMVPFATKITNANATSAMLKSVAKSREIWKFSQGECSAMPNGVIDMDCMTYSVTNSNSFADTNNYSSLRVINETVPSNFANQKDTTLEPIFPVSVTNAGIKTAWDVVRIGSNTASRTVALRPMHAQSGWFLGLCTQCQWTFNPSHGVPLAVFKTTIDDPRVQFTMILVY